MEMRAIRISETDGSKTLQNNKPLVRTKEIDKQNEFTTTFNRLKQPKAPDRLPNLGILRHTLNETNSWR